MTEHREEQGESQQALGVGSAAVQTGQGDSAVSRDPKPASMGQRMQSP